jgi:hypothetical protein
MQGGRPTAERQELGNKPGKRQKAPKSAHNHAEEAADLKY